MPLTVSQWPFLPKEQRTPAQNERWWMECYLPSSAEVTLRGIAHSVIVYGEPGSGKSTAIEAFERMEAQRLCLVHYPIARWPGEPHAWTTGFNHLGQIMACASMTVKNFITGHPDKIDSLSKTNLEFLRWLIEKYSGGCAFRRWADAINKQALLDLLEFPFDHLYPTDIDLSDVQGQVEELVTLTRRLGFEGVAVLVDIYSAAMINNAILEKIGELFGWLALLQFEGFAIKAALPEYVIKQAQLIERSRGRISFALLRRSAQECRELTNRHLQVATENELTSLLNIASEDLIDSLENEIIAVLYGAPSPQGWLRTASLLLDYYTKQGQKLTKLHLKDLIHLYFTHYVPLQFDKERQGVWQGKQFIYLDEQPFNFLEVLWRLRNSGEANQALLKMAGSQGNLNTIASRLRKKIEPVPEKPVYLHNTRSQGYWLENVGIANTLMSL